MRIAYTPLEPDVAEPGKIVVRDESPERGADGGTRRSRSEYSRRENVKPAVVDELRTGNWHSSRFLHAFQP